MVAFNPRHPSLDPAVLRADLIRAVQEHGAKRVAFEVGVARETVSRWANAHTDPLPVHRQVVALALVRLGVTPVTPAPVVVRR